MIHRLPIRIMIHNFIPNDVFCTPAGKHAYCIQELDRYVSLGASCIEEMATSNRTRGRCRSYSLVFFFVLWQRVMPTVHARTRMYSTLGTVFLPCKIRRAIVCTGGCTKAVFDVSGRVLYEWPNELLDESVDEWKEPEAPSIRSLFPKKAEERAPRCHI